MLKLGGVGGTSGRLAPGSFVPNVLLSNKVGEVSRPLLYCGRKYLSETQGKREEEVTSV